VIKSGDVFVCRQSYASTERDDGVDCGDVLIALTCIVKSPRANHPYGRDQYTLTLLIRDDIVIWRRNSEQECERSFFTCHKRAESDV